MVGAHQREAVDTALDQRARHLELRFRVVVVARKQQRVARFRQRALQRLSRMGEDRVVERRHHGPDGAGTPRRKRPCRSVGDVAQEANGGVDPFARSRMHQVGIRQRARGSRQRDLGGTRDVLKPGCSLAGHRRFLLMFGPCHRPPRVPTEPIGPPSQDRRELSKHSSWKRFRRNLLQRTLTWPQVTPSLG